MGQLERFEAFYARRVIEPEGLAQDGRAARERARYLKGHHGAPVVRLGTEDAIAGAVTLLDRSEPVADFSRPPLGVAFIRHGGGRRKYRGCVDIASALEITSERLGEGEGRKVRHRDCPRD